MDDHVRRLGLTLMELSFETVYPLFGLIDDVFLKGAVT